MLPRTFLPDRDLILCASLSRTMMTTNVHPLYLPPALCWINRTSVQVRRAKAVCHDALKVISSMLISVTVFVHAIRLWNMFAWGLVGSLWSLMVCVTLIGGSFLTFASCERRHRHSNTSVMVDPMSGVSTAQKIVMFILFLTTYIYTWLYYEWCSDQVLAVTRIECTGKRGPCLFSVMKWTTFMFVWINTVGLIRLL